MQKETTCNTDRGPLGSGLETNDIKCGENEQWKHARRQRESKRISHVHSSTCSALGLYPCSRNRNKMEKREREGRRGRTKKKKNTNSNVRAGRVFEAVAVGTRHAIQQAREAKTPSSPLCRQAVLLSCHFFLTRNQLLHQVCRGTRVLACSITRAMAYVTGIAGSQIVSRLESQRRDRTRATQGIKARSRRTLRCAVQQVPVLPFDVAGPRCRAVVPLPGLPGRRRLAGDRVAARAGLVDGWVEAR